MDHFDKIIGSRLVQKVADIPEVTVVYRYIVTWLISVSSEVHVLPSELSTNHVRKRTVIRHLDEFCGNSNTS